MTGLMRRLHREEQGFAIVVVMLLLAIMMVTLVVALNAGQAALRESDFGVKWSRTLALAESGIDDAIVTLGQDRSADPSCPLGGAVPCDGDGGEYQMQWSGDADGAVTVLATGFYPSVAEAKYTRTVQVLLEPVPSFQYALFAEDDLEVKNNANVDGSIYSTGAVILRQNATVCGSVVSANGSLTMETNVSIVTDDVDMACSGEDADVWVGGSITGAMGVVVEGDAKASAPSGTGCSALSTSYQIVGGTVQGSATACGQITSTVLGISSPGTSTSPPAVEVLPSFTFNEANYEAIDCYGGPGGCAETNTASDAVSRFQTDYNAMGGTIEGTYAIWQDSPTISDQILLDPLILSGDLTIVTNAPIDFGNTSAVTTVGGIDAELVVVTLYEPADATSCNTNGGDCSIYGQNQVTFDAGDPSVETDGIAALLYTSGKTAFKNTAVPSEFGEGALYSGSMDFMNGFDVTYNARIASILGFGSGLTVTLWQELSD